MGFAEGVILCFLGGWLNSYLYKAHLRKRNKGWIFWFALLWLGAFITIDFIIYVNLFDPRSIFPWLQINKNQDVGRYYMFTPGLLIGLPLELPVTNYDGVAWNIFALIFFISYIWWFTIGQNLGRLMYGRLEYEKGVWYLLRSTKMIKHSKEKLDKRTENK